MSGEWANQVDHLEDRKNNYIIQIMYAMQKNTDLK